MTNAHQPICRAVCASLLLLLPVACASGPARVPGGAAVAANITAHSQAGNAPAVSAERMTLAIRRYQKNKSLPPVQMRTTDSVDAADSGSSTDSGAQ